jgi:hypothetical protein
MENEVIKFKTDEKEIPVMTTEMLAKNYGVEIGIIKDL